MIVTGQLLAFTMNACREDVPTGAGFEPYSYANNDDKGGSWRTAVVADVSKLAIPAPPAPGSPEALAQLSDNVHTLAGKVDQLARVDHHGDSFAALENKIAALTADQVNAAFRKYVTPEEISIVKAGDFQAAGAYK